MPIQELEKEHFLLREEGSGTRAALENAFHEAEVPLHVSMHMGNNSAIKRGVAAGPGIASLSVALDMELEANRLVIFDVEGFPIMRQWRIVHLKDKHLSATSLHLSKHSYWNTRTAAYAEKSNSIEGKEIHMQFGRCYEEFEVGALYKHWPGRTITEYDDTLFCMLTMNHNPLHIDANYTENTRYKQRLVAGPLIFSIALGMSVADVSGNAVANLEFENVNGLAPTFHGDTIYAETKVLDKRLTSSKPEIGIVTVETIAYNQRGQTALLLLTARDGSHEVALRRATTGLGRENDDSAQESRGERAMTGTGQNIHSRGDPLWSPSKISLRRSELSTPASNERMIEKAAASSADLVFLDMEVFRCSQ